MKFISLATTITSALGLAAIATAAASSPLGGPCANKDHYECGNTPNYNNDKDFSFYCTSANIITNVQNCDCFGCCALNEEEEPTCL
ncbi:hypothetical protein K503DRAFT_770311 [Rhizopogon vinicolor AM-OR11-026]|uniref:Chitin-binding type-2 domain-containing protein n=1 Tax=Rhizopogon vinicolor AM-OR11-026 TaxID=1314800 RepID=A0A1B7N185_9AGAM|nr:hypothetical protein K503DRAFT_770311 [Rhizopogon vinicolor AM-OR11-026]